MRKLWRWRRDFEFSLCAGWRSLFGDLNWPLFIQYNCSINNLLEFYYFHIRSVLDWFETLSRSAPLSGHFSSILLFSFGEWTFKCIHFAVLDYCVLVSFFISSRATSLPAKQTKHENVPLFFWPLYLITAVNSVKVLFTFITWIRTWYYGVPPSRAHKVLLLQNIYWDFTLKYIHAFLKFDTCMHFLNLTSVTILIR